MSFLTLSRARTALPRLSSGSSQIRFESSARRTTKRLRIHPDPSFPITAESPAGTHIIYNPPATASTPRQTPSLFLPDNDPRKKSLLSVPLFPTEGDLPPPVRPVKEKSYHLTPADMQKMRELRAQDPEKYNRTKLAEMFNCSRLFVGMVAEASEERKAAMEERLESVKRKWGEKKRRAREERRRRIEGHGGLDGLLS